MQLYLFAPYNSEASSDTDSTIESNEEQFEQPQNTVVSDQCTSCGNFSLQPPHLQLDLLRE